MAQLCTCIIVKDSLSVAKANFKRHIKGGCSEEEVGYRDAQRRKIFAYIFTDRRNANLRTGI